MTAQIELIPLSMPDMPDSSRDLTGLCDELFATFTRSDQRRWGEVYVRGLVSLPGRKTIRRIAEHVVGRRADQSLQQFVNQSPWRWEPVRSGLAHEVAGVLRPRALIIEEAVFPKKGDSSVGVARQFAASHRRMLNCQLGLAAFFAGDSGSAPVNWRLQLPKEWNEDPGRRERGRLPDSVRYRPRWSHALDLIDELLSWGLPALPVLIDARNERNVELLLHGLEERDVPYVVRVSEDAPVVPAPSTATFGATAAMRAGELVGQARRMGRMTMNWRETVDGRATVSQVVFVPVRGTRGPIPLAPGKPYRRARRVLAEWVSGQAKPDAVQLTNITHTRLPELVHLLRLREQSPNDLNRLFDESGLGHFEGRSYTGWHHHVTLSSVAHAYRLMREIAREQPVDEWMRPYA